MDFEIKGRYEEAKLEIDKLQQQKALIARKTEACISNLCPDIRRNQYSSGANPCMGGRI